MSPDGYGIVAAQGHATDPIFYRSFHFDSGWIDSSWRVVSGTTGGHSSWYESFTIGIADDGSAWAIQWQDAKDEAMKFSMYEFGGACSPCAQDLGATSPYYDAFRDRHVKLEVVAGTFLLRPSPEAAGAAGAAFALYGVDPAGHHLFTHPVDAPNIPPGWHRDPPTPEVPTLALDKLVQEGVELNHFYAHHMCSSSRSSRSSGRLPLHVNVGTANPPSSSRVGPCQSPAATRGPRVSWRCPTSTSRPSRRTTSGGRIPAREAYERRRHLFRPTPRERGPPGVHAGRAKQRPLWPMAGAAHGQVGPLLKWGARPTLHSPARPEWCTTPGATRRPLKTNATLVHRLEQLQEVVERHGASSGPDVPAPHAARRALEHEWGRNLVGHVPH